MKYIFIRAQLLLVSVILLATFVLMMVLVMRYNSRWDFTKEKIYSLGEPTAKLLSKMNAGKIEVKAFYPHDDTARSNFELFLRECQLHHRDFHFDFYDPERVPSLSKQLHVKDLYTVIVSYEGREERMVGPTEEIFANALLRLANPKNLELCFVAGHGEASISRDDRSGYKQLRQSLEDNNYKTEEVILLRDQIPAPCNVFVVAGPHQDFAPEELDLLKQAFQEGKGIFFLIDPMDPGAGKTFTLFMRDFGVVLGEDVVVDKMSRMVGGDFLVPLVTQYVTQHPVTANFNQPTFFPVVRSVQPSTDPNYNVEVVPLALTGSGSWAESNLAALEKGETVFEPEGDLSGPISIAVACEMKSQAMKSAKGEVRPGGGRMVVVGDADFLTNAYLRLSGNENLALNMIRWLARDDRFIEVHLRYPEFKPLLLNERQRFLVLIGTIGVIPFSFFILGATQLVLRRRAA